MGFLQDPARPIVTCEDEIYAYLATQASYAALLVAPVNMQVRKFTDGQWVATLDDGEDFDAFLRASKFPVIGTTGIETYAPDDSHFARFPMGIRTGIRYKMVYAGQPDADGSGTTYFTRWETIQRNIRRGVDRFFASAGLVQNARWTQDRIDRKIAGPKGDKIVAWLTRFSVELEVEYVVTE